VVACFELKQPTSLIGIAFLVIPGSIQIGMDAVDYLFDLNDKVRAKDCHFIRLDPVHRCTAAMVIQSFKGCHSKALPITVVVKQLSQR
jgi:hypothetical protein